MIEQEPGAAGEAVSRPLQAPRPRAATPSRTDRPTGAKDVRARPVAAAAENGLIKIVRGRNTNDFLDELAAFPHAPHDDCVDALAGAHKKLAVNRGRSSVHVPQGHFDDYHPSDAAAHAAPPKPANGSATKKNSWRA